MRLKIGGGVANLLGFPYVGFFRLHKISGVLPSFSSPGCYLQDTIHLGVLPEDSGIQAPLQERSLPSALFAPSL